MNKTLRILIVLIVLGFPAFADQVAAFVIPTSQQVQVVSDLSHSIIINNEVGTQFGDKFFIQGYLYEDSTLAEHCPSTLDCGVFTGEEPFTGQPEFPEQQIGTFYVSRNFFADPFPGTLALGEEVGLFQVILQFFDEGDVLVAKGIQRFGENESHPATLAVLGGTGVFAKARGELIESMVTQNVSGAFTFTYDLSRIVNVKRERSGPFLGKFLKRFETR